MEGEDDEYASNSCRRNDDENSASFSFNNLPTEVSLVVKVLLENPIGQSTETFMYFR